MRANSVCCCLLVSAVLASLVDPTYPQPILDADGHPFQPMVDDEGHAIQPVIGEDGHPYYPDEVLQSQNPHQPDQPDQPEVQVPPPQPQQEAAQPDAVKAEEAPPQNEGQQENPPLSGQDLLDSKNSFLQEHIGVDKIKFAKSGDNNPKKPLSPARRLDLPARDNVNVWNREDVFSPIGNLAAWQVADGRAHGSSKLQFSQNLNNAHVVIGLCAVVISITVALGCCAKFFCRILLLSSLRRKDKLSSSRGAIGGGGSSLYAGQSTLDKLRIRVLGDQAAINKKTDSYFP